MEVQSRVLSDRSGNLPIISVILSFLNDDYCAKQGKIMLLGVDFSLIHVFFALKTLRLSYKSSSNIVRFLQDFHENILRFAQMRLGH